MNFLAHLFLSCEQEELLIGNFLADFIKNKAVETYSQGIQEGIQLHRKIDHFTDRHPMVLKGVHRLHEKHHKYAPVIVDVFYDYLLVKNWDQYSKEAFIPFTRRMYRILEQHKQIMPRPVQVRLSNMIAGDWLIGYGRFEGIAFTFDRMKFRLSKPEYLEDVMKSLKDNLDEFNEEFNAFFPDAISFVKEECKC